jgi:hypothetical protein
MGWSVDINHEESISAIRGEPPIRVVITGADWGEIKEAYAAMLDSLEIAP